MKDNTLVNQDYYRKRLEEFIQERHPRLKGAYGMIAARARQAEAIYRESLHAGQTPLAAVTRADAVLYAGLIFSRFDTLRCIIATEYPTAPEGVQRKLAAELETHFEDVFGKYNLDDGILNRSEYNHLIVDLIEALDIYFSQSAELAPYRIHRRKRR